MVGQWNVGRLNYRKPDNPVDWTGFREEVQMLLDSIGVDYIIKKAFRIFNYGSMERRTSFSSIV